jgi:hypothetical protein
LLVLRAFLIVPCLVSIRRMRHKSAI